MTATYSNVSYTLESGMSIWWSDDSFSSYEWYAGPGWYIGHEALGDYGPFTTALDAENEAEKIAAYY